MELGSMSDVETEVKIRLGHRWSDRGPPYRCMRKGCGILMECEKNKKGVVVKMYMRKGKWASIRPDCTGRKEQE